MSGTHQWHSGSNTYMDDLNDDFLRFWSISSGTVAGQEYHNHDHNATSPCFHCKYQTTFAVRSHPDRYNSHIIINVVYKWNRAIADCYENDAILDRSSSLTYFVLSDHLLPHIGLPPQSQTHVFSEIQFETIAPGLLAFDPYTESAGIAYPLIPDMFCPNLPRVSIHDLKRLDMRSHPSYHIASVRIDNDGDDIDYVAQHAGLAPDSERDLQLLMTEVELMMRLEHPCIVKPTHIMHDPDVNTFRGYLVPFYPRGSLSDVIEGGNLGKLSTRPNKLKWAKQIASAIACLHENSVYSGDLSIHSVMLQETDDICLRSVAPRYYTVTEWNHPPGVIDFVLSGPRDIWSFGNMLWEIWEEKQFSQFQRRSWTETGDRVAPAWYRQLAESCLADQAEERPTIVEALARLKEGEFSGVSL